MPRSHARRCRRSRDKDRFQRQRVGAMHAQKKKKKKETVMIGQKKNKKTQDLFPSPQIGGWLACCSALPPTQHQQLEPCCSSLPPHNTSSSARPPRTGSPDTPLSKPVQVRPKWAKQVQGAHARDQVSLD